jgi:hypothetical protein
MKISNKLVLAAAASVIVLTMTGVASAKRGADDDVSTTQEVNDSGRNGVRGGHDDADTHDVGDDKSVDVTPPAPPPPPPPPVVDDRGTDTDTDTTDDAGDDNGVDTDDTPETETEHVGGHSEDEQEDAGDDRRRGGRR